MEEIMEEIFHHCLILNNSICGDIQKIEEQWILTVHEEATEEDLLSDCRFEMVGDIISTVRLKVRYCPYCGDKLIDA